MAIEEVRFGPAERQVVDIRRPEELSRRIGLFYVHGGGWYGGGRESFHGHLDHFGARGHVVAATGYRIDEQAGYRAKLDDVLAGLATFRHRLAEESPEVDRIVVLGSSAGAHLATMLALRSTESESEGERAPIAACVSINGPGTLVPWPELDAEIRTKIEWLQADGSTTEEITPERQVRQGCPPFLFLLAEHEHLFPHDQVRALAAVIEEHGGWTETAVVPGTRHGFVYALGGPAQDRALELITAFLDRVSATLPDSADRPR